MESAGELENLSLSVAVGCGIGDYNPDEALEVHANKTAFVRHTYGLGCLAVLMAVFLA